MKAAQHQIHLKLMSLIYVLAFFIQKANRKRISSFKREESLSFFILIMKVFHEAAHRKEFRKCFHVKLLDQLLPHFYVSSTPSIRCTITRGVLCDVLRINISISIQIP